MKSKTQKKIDQEQRLKISLKENLFKRKRQARLKKDNLQSSNELKEKNEGSIDG